jgi:hypothetical protein
VNFSAVGWVEKERSMTEFILDILGQLFGLKKSPTRHGKVSLSRNAYHKMREHKLDFESLEHVFRNGREVKMLVEDYTTFSIGITYKYDYVKREFVITSCWKREHTW